jgi:hypothetical protein
MVAIPAATAETNPEEAFTVATLVLSEDHVPPGVPLLEKVVEPVEQIACVPLSVPAFASRHSAPVKLFWRVVLEMDVAVNL